MILLPTLTSIFGEQFHSSEHNRRGCKLSISWTLYHGRSAVLNLRNRRPKAGKRNFFRRLNCRPKLWRATIQMSLCCAIGRAVRRCAAMPAHKRIRCFAQCTPKNEQSIGFDPTDTATIFKNISSPRLLVNLSVWYPRIFFVLKQRPSISGNGNDVWGLQQTLVDWTHEALTSLYDNWRTWCVNAGCCSVSSDQNNSFPSLLRWWDDNGLCACSYRVGREQHWRYCWSQQRGSGGHVAG